MELESAVASQTNEPAAAPAGEAHGDEDKRSRQSRLERDAAVGGGVGLRRGERGAPGRAAPAGVA